MKKLTAIIFISLTAMLSALAVEVEMDLNYFYTFTNHTNSLVSGNVENHEWSGSSWTDTSTSDGENLKKASAEVQGGMIGIENLWTFYFGKPLSWVDIGFNVGADFALDRATSLAKDDGNSFSINSAVIRWSAMLGLALRFNMTENQYLYFSPQFKYSGLESRSGTYPTITYGGGEYDIPSYYAGAHIWSIGLNLDVGYKILFKSWGNYNMGMNFGANLSVPVYGYSHVSSVIPSSGGGAYTETYLNGYVTGGFTGNIYVGVCFNFGKK